MSKKAGSQEQPACVQNLYDWSKKPRLTVGRLEVCQVDRLTDAQADKLLGKAVDLSKANHSPDLVLKQAGSTSRGRTATLSPRTRFRVQMQAGRNSVVARWTLLVVSASMISRSKTPGLSEPHSSTLFQLLRVAWPDVSGGSKVGSLSNRPSK